MQSSSHKTGLQINQSQQFRVCKTTRNNKHQNPPLQKSTPNMVHLWFTLLWYTNCSFPANDILFIINAHSCFHFDRISNVLKL
jgi:hypothetical protein